MLLVSCVKKEGHLSKMCRSNPKITSAATCSHRLATMLISNTTSASLGSLKQAALYVLVGENGAGTTLMDTGSTGSFISLSYMRKHKLQKKSAAGNVSMASSSLKASIKGQCTVDLNLLGEWYPDVKLSVLPHLCLFVAASHQTRLETWSKTRRPIKVGIKGRGRSGTSGDSNPAGLCCSSAHLVQCEPDEASSFTNPNVGPSTYAGLWLELDNRV